MNIKFYSLLIILWALHFGVGGQNHKSGTKKEYLEILKNRSEKIVNEYLDINDKQKAKHIQNIIAKQYLKINKVHDTLDAKIEKLKNEDVSDSLLILEEKMLKEDAYKKLSKLNARFLKVLRKNLNNDQVEAVKNGMTYNLLNHTYNGYLDMLPQLSESQKRYIYSKLVEAREKALVEGSSERKHYWFGKYKGIINNYLSNNGYDLKQASVEWRKRLNEQKE